MGAPFSFPAATPAKMQSGMTKASRTSRQFTPRISQQCTRAANAAHHVGTHAQAHCSAFQAGESAITYPFKASTQRGW